MKKAYLALIISALASSSLMADAIIGQPAPGFSVKDIDGKSHALADYKGKVVVLENYNLDCPYVQNHYKSGAMQELQGEAIGQGVVWLLVNSSYNDPAKAKQEIESQNIKGTALLYDPSGSIGKRYGFKTTPHMIIIDKDGRVAYDGAIDDKPVTEGNPREARNYVRQALKQVLAGEPVAKPQTKPYGCGVKYAR